MLIANSSPGPIYEQIVRQIKAQIIAGELGEGAPLPSIRKLAQDLQISAITSKRAYDELEAEGFIDTVAGVSLAEVGQMLRLLWEEKA